MKFIFVFLGFGIIELSAHCTAHLGVRAQSFGGAIRAEASSNDSIFFNPAGIIKNRRISPDIDYLLDSDAHAHRIGASVVDSKTSAWGLGLAYSGRFVSKSDQPSSHLLYLAAAMPIATDIFAVGVSIHYAHDRGPGPDPYENFFNMDTGLLVNLPMGLSLAVVADHLIKAKGHEKSLGLGLGTAFDLGTFIPAVPLSVSFDWLMDDVKSEDDLGHIIASGMQFLILDMIPVRIGYRSALAQNQKLLSLGTGIMAGGFAVDALYQQDLIIGKGRHFGVALRWAI